ncbi:MAG: hypothetical protein FJZ11_03730 [Candidatus Omnitrophica bacterium]|nr:hypothetical protein [Candidatus Omnitrophota bacterium]
MKNKPRRNLKKYLFFVIVIIVLLWVAFVFVNQFKMRFAENKYYQDYVKIVSYDFNKYKQNATINIAIHNFGRRLLNSVLIKIDYYDNEGKLLGSDLSDVLKMSKDFLYPESGKVFQIEVSYPEGTSGIKLSIK